MRRGGLVAGIFVGAAALQLGAAPPAPSAEGDRTPIRPGSAEKGVPFWNDYATLFRAPPVLSFDAVPGAAHYRFEIRRGDWTRACAAARPEVSLVAFWPEMAKGTGWSVTCTAHAADGAARGAPQMRRFTKTARFEDVAFPPAAMPYREAARRIFAYMTALPAMRTLVETGEPEQGYQHNAYVSKTHAAHITAMLAWAQKMPESRAQAMRFAAASAELLLRELEPAGAPLAHWPPTYGRRPLRGGLKADGGGARKAMVGNDPEGAAKYRREVMLCYPAAVGHAFVAYFRATGERRFLDAAVRIAETYVRVRRADGSWPLKMVLATGAPVGRNALVPSQLLPFAAALAEATGDARWRQLADDCFAFLERGPFRTMNWDGQFEDIEPKPPYQGLTKHNALDGMLEILRRRPVSAEKMALARDLLRFSEDQFVFWEAPCARDEAIPKPGGAARGECPALFRPGGYDYPSVFEQYSCYVSIDASAAKLIRAYLAMWRATGNATDLAKARVLGDQMTREVQPDGRLPTFWSNDWLGAATYDWLNCMEASACVLLELADHTS